jgi:hypothetical protein
MAQQKCITLKRRTIRGKRAFFPNPHNFEILHYNFYQHVMPNKLQISLKQKP